MHKWLIYIAFGWLTLTGALHFAIDVVSQHLRGKHPPGAEATLLYYGLHSAYALGQVVVGLLALFVATRAMPLLATTPPLALALLAGLGWLAIACLFSPYWPPRINAAVFCALVLAAWLTRPAAVG
ncbi:hypothetical protein E2F46_09535 [Luteimonas aestuarii]|uniref:Uncharacterized protein n=1 Tax=Luteimonas aestuarii TaxID=453837 RepID=A0A4R5TP17_9GAMM|nr:hypothetical protein [Luteimonas aestuarii]TDK23766.1 hypothetical protein E2F46_09535 [Luteimonas aestuarii]